MFAADGVDAYRQGLYAKAVEPLTSDSKKDPIVDYYIARMRLLWLRELKNNTSALHYFKQAANKGLLSAQNMIGTL